MVRLILLLCALAVQTGFQPIYVSVAYDGKQRARFPEELAAIRKAGFNAITTAKPSERLRAAAAKHGLAVLEDAGTAAERVRVGTGRGAVTPRQARLAFWSAIAAGKRRFTVVSRNGPLPAAVVAVGESAGVVTRNQALFAPLVPRAGTARKIRVEPHARITTHVLESPDAIAIIALNHAAETRRVTLRFPADMPEAIWQNMEAGNAVHFILGNDGPYLEHTFAPHDALVLVIRKKLR